MTSLLVVKRNDLKSDWSRGILYVGGQPDGFTVEDEIRDKAKKIAGETAIPYGTDRKSVV